IDLTGAWTLSGPYIDEIARINADPFIAFIEIYADTRRDFEQTGAVLSTAVPGGSAGIGAVNPATGAFTTHTPVAFFDFSPFFSISSASLPMNSGYADEIITGNAPGGSNAFTGTATLTVGGITLVGPMAVIGQRSCQPGQPCCGNGIVESGEVCDDPFC